MTEHDESPLIASMQYTMDVRRWAIDQVIQAVRDGGQFLPMTDITAMAEHITRYVLRGDNHGLCPLQSGHP